ncbi:hypothetical protein BC938DRAFT_481889 [Jimgerdemannia flammicorona]|uniref:Uncharacterized protein n=1 Tax=Jimgerdemannia flammicorona TaxID=994334 RepID=A0A433QF50_9FUNG|nr:hypothetical protein BC938DRAFT_481889 [Jimgerdemannia flammicorona]
MIRKKVMVDVVGEVHSGRLAEFLFRSDGLQLAKLALESQLNCQYDLIGSREASPTTSRASEAKGHRRGWKREVDINERFDNFHEVINSKIYAAPGRCCPRQGLGGAPAQHFVRLFYIFAPLRERCRSRLSELGGALGAKI